MKEIKLKICDKGYSIRPTCTDSEKRIDSVIDHAMKEQRFPGSQLKYWLYLHYNVKNDTDLFSIIKKDSKSHFRNKVMIAKMVKQVLIYFYPNIYEDYLLFCSDKYYSLAES